MFPRISSVLPEQMENIRIQTETIYLHAEFFFSTFYYQIRIWFRKEQGNIEFLPNDMIRFDEFFNSAFPHLALSSYSSSFFAILASYGTKLLSTLY